MSKRRAFIIFASAVGSFLLGVVDDIRLFLRNERESIQSLGTLTATVIALAALYYSSRSAQSSQESAIVAQNSLSYMEKEFHIRNRPYLFIGGIFFSGKEVDVARVEYPHSIKFEVFNASSIPATKVTQRFVILIDKKQSSITVVPSGYCIPQKGQIESVFLTDNEYAAATNSVHAFEICISIEYFGVLNEVRPYTFTQRAWYDAPAKSFKSLDVEDNPP